MDGVCGYELKFASGVPKVNVPLVVTYVVLYVVSPRVRGFVKII
jgi:hypothetical protein